MASELTASGSTVTWSIPSLPESNKKLLCHGYIRTHFEQSIPYDIIALFQQYFCMRSTCIEDIHAIETHCDEPIVSPVFECHRGMKWYLELWPRYSTICTFPDVIFIISDPCFFCAQWIQSFPEQCSPIPLSIEQNRGSRASVLHIVFIGIQHSLTT